MVAFFEERRGRLHGFRWRDRLDHSSAAPGVAVSPVDQVIGTGDGTTATFQLSKTYGGIYAPYARPIVKPDPGSVRVAVDEAKQDEGTEFTCDATTGVVTFLPGHIPAAGLAVTAGFRVRRAGALRHGLSRGRSVGVRGGRDSENSAG